MTKDRKSFIALLTGMLSILPAQDCLGTDDVAVPKDATPAISSADVHRPTAIPDRIILTWGGDPKTSQAVTWRTSTEVKKGIAEIVIADAGPYFSEKSKPIVATTEFLKTDLNEAHFHSVRFDELHPGTKYAYRVGDGTHWSEWFHFSTAKETPEPFSFIYFGDAQNNLKSMWSRVVREAYSDAPKAKFLIHAGDLINRADSDAEWGEWFGAGGWINGTMPSLPVPGNHEQAKREDGGTRTSHHWRPQFTLPENGPSGLEETCFFLRYQDVLFIGMDSNREIAKQAEWLESILKSNRSKWVICTFHHPVFSTAKDRDNPAIRKTWKPIFDKYHVDLVLQGHDHTYGRTGLSVPSSLESSENELQVREKTNEDTGEKATGSDADASRIRVAEKNIATGLQAFDQETGTVYVVSVSGPKMYNIKKQSFMKRLAEDTQLYQLIHVDGDTLRFEARTAIGQLYDAFELKKRKGQINELTELQPEIGLRLRPSKETK